MILRTHTLMIIVGMICLLCEPSHATPPTQTDPSIVPTADRLYKEGHELVKSGRYHEACPKFKASEELRHHPDTQFSLADCYERTGRFASALEQFRSLVDDKNALSAARMDAAAHVRALEPKVALLTLAVSPAVAQESGLEIKRNGTTVIDRLWGVPVAVDPGIHVISVRAPGKQPQEHRVTIGDKSVTVNISDLEVLNQPRLTLTVPPTVAKESGLEIKRNGTTVVAQLWGVPVAVDPGIHVISVSAPGKQPQEHQVAITDKSVSVNIPDLEMLKQRKIALGVGGAGLGLIVAGAVTGVLTFSKWGDARKTCGDTAFPTCDTSARYQMAEPVARRAFDLSVASTITFAAGGAALASAVVLWFTASSEPSAPPRTGWFVTPTVSTSQVGAAAQWSF